MKPIRIFVSYAREDKRWFQLDDPYGLIPWLEDSLRKLDVIFWHDSNLVPGNFTARIVEEIDEAQIAVLLVSQAFLNSRYIEETELPRIKAHMREGRLEVVPILVGACAWDEDDFLRNFQILPGKPTPLLKYIKSEADWDEVRFEILDGLKKLVKRIRVTRSEKEITEKVPTTPSVEAISTSSELAEVRPYCTDSNSIFAKLIEPTFEELVAKIKPPNGKLDQKTLTLALTDLGMVPTEVTLLMGCLRIGGRDAFLEYVPTDGHKGYTFSANEGAGFSYLSIQEAEVRLSEMMEKLKRASDPSLRKDMRREIAKFIGAFITVSVPCSTEEEFLKKSDRLTTYRRVARVIIERSLSG
jgi:hypothetical protein